MGYMYGSYIITNNQLTVTNHYVANTMLFHIMGP